MCGEYCASSTIFSASSGSSPRVWGIRCRWCRGVNRFCGSSPRVWGIRENTSTISTPSGSSPRVWGIRALTSVAVCSGTVHPHVCGEYCHLRLCDSGRLGSSPRVWGILCKWSVWVWCTRFIPTCVGNTPTANANRWALTVHPHVCGEYSAACPALPAPRRFIPTCVGNTSCCRKGIICLSVHPHVCGEYVFPGIDLLGRAGSSPRVWGILRLTKSAE